MFTPYEAEGLALLVCLTTEFQVASDLANRTLLRSDLGKPFEFKPDK